MATRSDQSSSAPSYQNGITAGSCPKCTTILYSYRYERAARRKSMTATCFRNPTHHIVARTAAAERVRVLAPRSSRGIHFNVLLAAASPLPVPHIIPLSLYLTSCGGDATLAIVLFVIGARKASVAALKRSVTYPLNSILADQVSLPSDKFTTASCIMSQQPVYNAPMALDPDLPCTAGTEPLLALARIQGHMRGIRKCTLGPVPVPEFLETFVPQFTADRSALLSSRNAFNHMPSRADSVAEIYKPLTFALNKRTKFKSRCPGFVFMPTFEHSIRPLRLGYAKPHICCVKAENSVHIEKAHPGSRTEFGYAELFIHVTADPTDDIFVDPPSNTPEESLLEHEFVRDLFGGEDEVTEKDFLELEARYKRQRLFLFTISMAGSMARFYRWDRSGCIVSRSFDIRQHPDFLVEFLWRFSDLTDVLRGHDLTVRMASAAEEALFKGAIRDYLALQREGTGENLDKALSAHYCPAHVTVVNVTPHSSETTGETTFIVSRPVVSPLSLDGRSTRGYWAVNCASGQVGFLKDTWRTYHQREIEGDILRRLNELGVRNVPVLAVHGDVIDDMWDSSDSGLGYQETMTNRYILMPWASRMDGKAVNVHRRRHYRLVTHTVGQSLKMLRGTEELLHSTYDVFIAMRDALAKDSRIHRDLSVGNIILVKESGQTVRKGYLIDWDASDRVDEHGEALQSGRAGTWAFMSIRMLGSRFQDGKQTFKDDMEALIYVVLHSALFYLPHDLDARDFTEFNKDFFEERQVAGDVVFGAKGKLANAEMRHMTSSIQFGSAAFKEWLDTVLDYHTPRRGCIGMGEMWEPETLDTYWSRFLATHTLERNDRTVHRLIKRDRYDPDSPHSEPILSPDSHSSRHHVPVHATAADGSRRGKRSHGADEEPAASSSRLKRACGDRSPRPSELPLRRSQRIREQRSRLQVVVAAPAPDAQGAISNGPARVASTTRRRK
ncbi:hypothetical protein PYCCODRAFT_1481381 [Trametes coccinea BRFM310]|uniref:Fungal-type protein kinase domain-containing protein n=1 Tax=Trametes coccinea (strain BRFM310) TaxID=1353009 RepID=A0A1Y2I862_TRAC3|nr:hypothetical protein PYCCODRAFT_1481381 [Trametes coccinea BRFM310]